MTFGNKQCPEMVKSGVQKSVAVCLRCVSRFAVSLVTNFFLFPCSIFYCHKFISSSLTAEAWNPVHAQLGDLPSVSRRTGALNKNQLPKCIGRLRLASLWSMRVRPWTYLEAPAASKHMCLLMNIAEGSNRLSTTSIVQPHDRLALGIRLRLLFRLGTPVTSTSSSRRRLFIKIHRIMGEQRRRPL